jgi:hypothetical protein
MSEKNLGIIIDVTSTGMFFIPANTVPTASFIQFTSTATGSTSESAYVTNSLFVSHSELVAASASFFIEQDPNDKTAVQFRIPSSSTTGLTKELLPIYISGSGRVGVGTNDPKTQFDIKTAVDSSEGTRFLLRSARASDNPLQVGDDAGEIDFVVESGSFAKLETSGSIGRLKGVITNVTKAGATGKIVLGVAKDLSQDSLDIVEWRYNGVTAPGYFQEMSSSILIKDFSTSIRSRLEFQKSSNGFVYMSLQTGSMKGTGDIIMDGTGSFGLIEGGTF